MLKYYINNQKGNAQILMLGMVVILFLAGVFYLRYQKDMEEGYAEIDYVVEDMSNESTESSQSQMPNTSGTNANVKSTQDLKNLNTELDNTNVDVVDEDLNKNNSDMSAF